MLDVGPDEISVTQLKALMDQGAAPYLLDVRTPAEHQFCRLPHSTLIPMHELPTRAAELDAHADTVVYCRSGGRSHFAVQYLKKLGFTKVRNLVGGVLAWSDQIDPSMPKY
jgi:adenylyltransferase/sulfurtransferase